MFFERVNVQAPGDFFCRVLLPFCYFIISASLFRIIGITATSSRSKIISSLLNHDVYRLHIYSQGAQSANIAVSPYLIKLVSVCSFDETRFNLVYMYGLIFIKIMANNLLELPAVSYATGTKKTTPQLSQVVAGLTSHKYGTLRHTFL